ncbi:hypothetical protein HOF65_08105 [bacterium]|nr:hypothetical protein [bacterium]MBT4633524.1 hypothetical protein [bacterium]MBT6778479.1 hypothetical protein [bacterium]
MYIKFDLITLLFTNKDCLFLLGKLTFGSDIYPLIVIQFIEKFNSNRLLEKSSQYILYILVFKSSQLIYLKICFESEIKSKPTFG